MPSLVIKNLPEELHVKLKEQAARHHRSMTREAIAILSDGVGQMNTREMPAPYRGRIPITDELINEAKREGRK
ncbi:MAG: Arc family DNA-binding protein [Gammaproteobacteria bacterium]|nr:Arc family DNA-binding protein [Gammaproteobacteria bacterium]